jgi:hypothetical protein
MHLPAAALRAARLVGALLAVGLALTANGCGSAKHPRPAELRLERTDLALMSRTLERLESPIRNEVTAARDVWPALNQGLPQGPVPPATQQGIFTAAARAQAVQPPSFVTKPNILTGPAAATRALLHNYTDLAQRGWRLTEAAVSPADPPKASRPPTTAPPSTPANQSTAVRLLRANSGLYIYCIYDAHFYLSLIGKQLQHAYQTLGGPPAFGQSLTQPQIEALARFYSPPSVRLEPHPPPSLGA